MARVDLHVQGIDIPLWVRRFHIREALSTTFECTLVVRSLVPDLDIDTPIWANAMLSIEAGISHVQGGGRRMWTGVIEWIEQMEVESSGLSTYQVRLVPQLFLLTQNQNYRIFQRKTIPAMVDILLEEWGIEREWRICHDAFPVLECRTQYGESDFTFLSRLCEEAGISFFLLPLAERGSVLILSEDPASAPIRGGVPLLFEASPNEAAEAEYVTRMSFRRRGAPRRIVLRDMDPRRPGFPLHGEANASGVPSARAYQYYFTPGAMKVHTMHPPAPGKDMPAAQTRSGRHDIRAGKDLAARLLHAEAAQMRIASFETNVFDLGPGSVIAIEKHPHPLLDPKSHKLLISESIFEGETEKEWRLRCGAVWADMPYRPLHKTPRPVVHGYQTAIVMGPRDREIYTDAEGRVMTRFFWDDREGERAEDAHASCWMRVAQVWTGAGFGIHAVPRVGQEVLVSFHGGNPDEPMIVGQVPNALTPAPYSLPEHETRTVIRTRTTPEGDGYNELSFEDRKGKELFYQRAERDHETHVRRELRELVEGDRRRMVGGDEHVSVTNDRRGHVGGHANETIDGDWRVTAGGDASFSAGGDLNVSVKGKVAVEIAGDLHVRVMGQVVIEGNDSTLRGGGAFFRASGGAAMAAQFLENGGAPAVAGPSDPAAPDPPILPAAYRAPLPRAVVRLPVLAWPGSMPPVGTMSNDVVLCGFICECDKVKGKDGQRRASQTCLTKKLRWYDQALGGKSTLKAEVPYDMTQNPPVPIMSKNQPERPTTGSPGGSKIPDVVEVKDPDKPPTQDNIERVIEVKFGDDRLSEENKREYRRIAGPAPMETWTPETCGCNEREKQPEKIPNEVVEAAAIALLILVLLADDAVGGVADDVAIPPLVVQLLKRLGPLFKPGWILP